MAHHQSYAYDHFDPFIQNRGKACDELGSLLASYRNTAVSAQSLRRLGDELAPTKQQQQAARRVIDKVIHAVQSSPGINVDRCCVSGSFGKKTAIRDFDIDLVIFVNDQEPPFKSTLEKLTSHLPQLLPASLEMQVTTRFSVQFCLDGFNVDLLPGPNFATDTSNKRKQQYELSMAKIHALDRKSFENDVRYWVSALAEATVDCMKEQSPFVNAAVRLAKLWKNSCVVMPLTFPKWFSSFMVEIVAADAANSELAENPHDASLIRVLHRYFSALSTPEKLNVVGSRYSLTEIPDWVHNQRPLVLDPVNPLCNLAAHLSDWKTVKLLAKAALRTIENAQRLTVPQLFDVQIGEDIPRMYQQCNFHLRYVSDGHWLRSLEVRSINNLAGQRMDPGVDWRSRGSIDAHACQPEAQNILYREFQDFVNVSTTALLFQTRKAPSREVAAASGFSDEILSQVFLQPKSEWIPNSEVHESFDVSFTFGQIPIPSPKNDLRYIYLKLSTNLNIEQLYRAAHDIQREKREEEEDLEY